MLQPIIQNAGTTARERHLAKLASEQFFGLWSYPGLTRPAKKGVNKELADLTVIFGDDIILFSDKDIAWPSHPDTQVAWSRWYRESILASATQLWGAAKHLRGPTPAIYLDARCQVPFPLPTLSERTRIHLVAVAANSTLPAHDYFRTIGGPGSSGTLMHAFGAPDIVEGRRPFVVGDLDPLKPYIHILDEESLDRVVTELGTIGDFVHYLTEKEAAVRSGQLRMYSGEEELLAFYLQEARPDGYGNLSFAHRELNPDHWVYIPEGEWRAYESSAAYSVRTRMRELARSWHELIDPFSTAVLAADTGEANDTPLDMHEITLRVAASENLASRARLGTAFAEKYQSVPPGVRSSRAVSSQCHPGRIYIFVFVPWVWQSATYEEYREYRLSVMRAYAIVAPLKFAEATEFIVLGAQTRDATGGRSETMIYAKYDGPLDTQHIAQAHELMASEGIMADIPTLSSRGGAAQPALPRRFTRNEPCPCGSLKKNKKCCNIVGHRYSKIYAATIG
ncbi:SEC-C domain-containing protein [Stenotrophomonas indicatrix]|uniref:YecA family protein n=1 Tax=Stenotrophomonas indicatrix TaxID=2045451 RepID=UPI002FDB140C